MPFRPVEIRGLREALRTLEPTLIAKPLRKFFERSTLTVQNNARRKTPVDMGHLRVTLLAEVDRATVPQYGKVGWLNAREGTSLWFKARAMEFGTGRMGDPEVPHAAGHFPPGDALDTWARRHGFANGWVVANIIARRGGLRPRRMLRTGLSNSMTAIRGYVRKLSDDIAAEWKKK